MLIQALGEESWEIQSEKAWTLIYTGLQFCDHDGTSNVWTKLSQWQGANILDSRQKWKWAGLRVLSKNNFLIISDSKSDVSSWSSEMAITGRI